MSSKKKAARNSVATASQRKMLAVLKLFRIVIKSVRTHYQKVEQQTGVSGAQLWALAHISNTPGAKAGDLARALAIHPSTASNLLRRLVALGLVERVRSGHDQRTVLLHPTAKGERALKRAPKPLVGVLQQALSDLPGPRLDALGELLEELVRNMAVKDRGARTTPLSDM